MFVESTKTLQKIFSQVESDYSKMATRVLCNTHNHLKQMALGKDIPNQVNSDQIDKIHNSLHLTGNQTDKILNSLDETDDPTCFHLERYISDENARNEELFDVMKHEVNRLNSFTGKWPLCYIKPKDLSQNGFFYLQSEDKVQCAFCGVVIDDWNVEDKPLRKHMMKNPKCKFLMTGDAGNITFTRPKPTVKSVNKCIPSAKPTNAGLRKQKYPRMSDIKTRLLSYRDWPLIMLSSRQLAECGLFYTGVADVVTCFYCGGSLGNWELNDDPWVEHEKFYPDCGFLSLVKTRSKPTPSFPQMNLASPIKLNSAATKPSNIAHNSVQNEVIRQACEIFPSSLVQKVAVQYFRITGRHYTSLHDLCEAVLQHKNLETNMSNNKIMKNNDVTSNMAESTAALLNTLPIFKCDKESIVPNPRSCASYIKCSHHRRYVVPCPKNLHYRRDTGQCEIPCDAQCDQNLACECGWSTCIPDCEEPNGIYAYPDDCEKFVKCYNGKPSVFECSTGKAFNINRKKCLSISEPDCNGTNSKIRI